MTIGLYDIDLNHGHSFSLSLPLMKAYTKFYNQGHQVIMMKPYEKTGRYNKIFYFKDNPNLIVPKRLIFGEKSSLHGYGFFKEAKISEETKDFSPSFEPYLFNSSKIKNKSLFKSIVNNDIIDWREKDFTGTHKGRTTTYVNDRDFLQEEDWTELFIHYDNNIEFIHSIETDNYKQALDFLKLYTGNNIKISVPCTFDKNILLKLINFSKVQFVPKTDEELLLFIFAVKTLTEEKINIIHSFAATPLMKDLSQWAAAGQISFKDFLGINFDSSNYLKLKNQLLLKQNPKKITYEEFKSEYLTF